MPAVWVRSHANPYPGEVVAAHSWGQDGTSIWSIPLDLDLKKTIYPFVIIMGDRQMVNKTDIKK